MIEGLTPYPEYKESGLPWVPQIPAHWSLVPNRAVLRKRKILVGANHRKFRLLSLTKGGVIVRDISTGKGKFSSDMGTSQEVRRGDFVFCLFDVPETPRTVGLAKHDGMITGAYTVFESRRLAQDSVRYLERFYIAMDDRKLLSPLYSGLRHTIPPSRFLGTKTPHPPPDEQAAIVRFLDHANRKVGGFIQAKRKLIALLGEQKQVIIQTAISEVSRPDCHTMPVRAVLRPVKRLGFPAKTLLSLFRDFGVIPKNSRENKNVDVRDLALCQLVKPGDVVMNKMKAWQGSIAVSDIEGIVSPDYMVLEFQIQPVVKDFFHFVLRSSEMVASYRKQAYGVRLGQWRLMYPDFCRLRLPVPPIKEQQTIVNHIAHKTQSLKTAIARAEQEIALMHEYRTRLTADVVTGKLDVRAAAARLPALTEDAAAEPEVDLIEAELEHEEVS